MRLWRKRTKKISHRWQRHISFTIRTTRADRAPLFVLALILWVDEKNLSIETNAALTDALTYDYLQGTRTRFRNHISRKKGRGLFKLNVMKIGERVKPRLWQEQTVETPSGWFDTGPDFFKTTTRLQCFVVVQKIIKSELKWSLKKKSRK